MQPARARRGRPTGYAVAIAAWRSCGFCTGTLARACTGHAAGRHAVAGRQRTRRSEEHTSELQSHLNLVCRLLLEKKKKLGAFETTPKVPQSPRVTAPSAHPSALS